MNPLIALYAAWPAGVALKPGCPRRELLAAAFVGAIGLAAAVALILHASP